METVEQNCLVLWIALKLLAKARAQSEGCSFCQEICVTLTIQQKLNSRAGSQSGEASGIWVTGASRMTTSMAIGCVPQMVLCFAG